MKILFHFDEWHKDVWSGRYIDLDTWFILRSLWDVGDMACVNNTNLDILTGRSNFEVFDTLDDFMTAHSGEPMVQIQHVSKTNNLLTNLPTPTADTWYLFGPSAGFENINGIDVVSIGQNGVDSHHAPYIASIVAHEIWNR